MDLIQVGYLIVVLVLNFRSTTNRVDAKVWLFWLFGDRRCWWRWRRNIFLPVLKVIKVL
jgi:hypothetical protein